MESKITLEDHVSTTDYNKIWDSALEAARNGKAFMADVQRRLPDAALRLEDMDACGIETMIVSLTSPGIQAITDKAFAIDLARRTNDLINRTFVQPYPGRFYAFATVPMQDPTAAAIELERAVHELGMKGALINSYTNIGDRDTAQYLDAPEVREFWHRVSELNVPVYLHPREPLLGQRKIYEGYPELVGSAWGFAADTSVHAMRLMLSGLFDEYPGVKIILGHLGEGLPQLLPRAAWRLNLQRNGSRGGRNKKPINKYFIDNFYLTTSGDFHTNALTNAISEVGVEHVLFSVDYPYEQPVAACTWFDNLPLSENDKRLIGRTNAQRVLNI